MLLIIIVFSTMLFNLIYCVNKLNSNRIISKIDLSLTPTIVKINELIKIKVKSNYNSEILFDFDESILQKVNKKYFKAKKIGTTTVKAFQNETIFNKKNESKSILITIINNELSNENENETILKTSENNQIKIFNENESEKCNCDYSLSNKECGCKELPVTFDPLFSENFEITVGEEFNFEINAPTVNNIVIEVLNHNINFSYINKNQQLICNFKAVIKGESSLKIYCQGDYEYKYYIKIIKIKILPKNFEFNLLINKNLFSEMFGVIEKTIYEYHEENDIIYLDIDEILNFNFESDLPIKHEISNDHLIYKETDHNLKVLIPKKNGSVQVKFFNEDTNEYDKIEKIYTINIDKKIFPFIIYNEPEFSFKSTEERIILNDVSYSIKKNKEMYIYDLKDFALVFIKKLQHMYNKILDFEIINDYYFKDKNCIKISNNQFKMIKCGKSKLKIKFDLDFKIYKKVDLIIIVNCESVFNDSLESSKNPVSLYSNTYFQ